MGAMARVAVAGCSLLALAACSGGADDAAPPTTVTAPSTIASTTVAPSTTSAPTTTLSPQQQDEADIRELHDRFVQMLLATGKDPDPFDPSIPATSSGIQRQRWEEELERHRQLGQHYDGTLRSAIQTVGFDDADHAGVRTCTTDATVLLTASGDVVERADGQSFVTELRMIRTSDGWRVEDWFTGRTTRCGE
jgi:hypothetical protein